MTQKFFSSYSNGNIPQIFLSNKHNGRWSTKPSFICICIFICNFSRTVHLDYLLLLLLLLHCTSTSCNNTTATYGLLTHLRYLHLFYWVVLVGIDILFCIHFYSTHIKTLSVKDSKRICYFGEISAYQE